MQCCKASARLYAIARALQGYCKARKGIQKRAYRSHSPNRRSPFIVLFIIIFIFLLAVVVLYFPCIPLLSPVRPRVRLSNRHGADARQWWGRAHQGGGGHHHNFLWSLPGQASTAHMRAYAWAQEAIPARGNEQRAVVLCAWASYGFRLLRALLGQG